MSLLKRDGSARPGAATKNGALVVREGNESLVRAGCLPCPWVCDEERFHVQVGFAQVIARVIVDSVFSLQKQTANRGKCFAS